MEDTTVHPDQEPDPEPDPAAGPDLSGPVVSAATDRAGVDELLGSRWRLLDEVPLLGQLLSALVGCDRLIVTALECLMSLQDSGHAEAATGVGVG